ncbi:hypothetical protein [Sphaerisporangium corydalis]|uniref:DUF2092 domain-containing protein n=1 Tax=Sphaerisporangium corydalis TaxID=1441875 RepID=A0ABV9ELI4_9ACTN|nr:hypothetical protein [Sphaerisporangium corydalis]
MRRRIALAATALIAPALAMATPAPAQAAPATAHATAAAPRAVPSGPVDALRRQFAKRTTVRVDEVARLILDHDDLLSYRQSGVVRFGKTGVDAYDLRTSGVTGSGNSTVLRTIKVDGKVYLKSALYDDLLPAGRTWIRTSTDGDGVTSSMIDVLRPKVLAAVLATTKSKSPAGRIGGSPTVLLQGSITLAQLAKVSPDAGAVAKMYKVKKTVKLPWKLWIGADQLPRRFASTFPLTFSAKAPNLSTATDSRFAAWGGKVAITAPPADLVIDEEDIETDIPVPDDFTTTITKLAARER